MAKVLFLQNYWYESPAVMALSASLKQAGHQTSLQVGNAISQFRSVLENEKPDIVGFSLMSGLHRWGIKITEQIRKLNLSKQPFIIYGGPHPTFFPDILKNSLADAICIGEGEECLVAVANGIDRKENLEAIANLSIKMGGHITTNPLRPLLNLDQLPIMDREIYYQHHYFDMYPTKSFMTGRGCPFQCTFCYNKTIQNIYRDKGCFVRFRDPQKIIEEILQVIKRWKCRMVYFMDDTLGLKKSWALELMDLYKREVNLPFICKIRADTFDEEMIARFKEANCRTIQFAIEVANEKTRMELLKKQIRDEDIFKAARLLKKYKIKFLTYNMIGLPGENIEDIYNLIKLNIKIGTSYPWCAIFTPYPGTELAEYCIKKGYMSENFHVDQLESTVHKTTLIQNNNANQVTNLHKLFSLGIFCPWLIPVIRKVSKFRPNIFFSGIFFFIYFINYIRFEKLKFREAFMLGIKNIHVNLGSKD